jgi:transcriptional regulator with XRE-family HTH domain
VSLYQVDMGIAKGGFVHSEGLTRLGAVAKHVTRVILMSDSPTLIDLAGRLDQLFREHEVTNAAVAAAINTAAGQNVITPSYLSMLRRGQRTRISADKLGRLAAYFGVDLSYFTSPFALADLSQPVFTALADARVRTLAVTASGLSDASLVILVQTAARFKEAEAASQVEAEE